VIGLFLEDNCRSTPHRFGFELMVVGVTLGIAAEGLVAIEFADVIGDAACRARTITASFSFFCFYCPCLFQG